MAFRHYVQLQNDWKTLVQMNKIVCYTAITGNYDRLLDPLVVPSNIDFICFTDSLMQHSNVWKSRSIPNDLEYLSNIKKQRIIKICPHRYLSEYDISVWIDGNFLIKNDLNEFLQQYDLDKNFLYTRIHPKRNCIYDEAQECINLHKDISDIVDNQIQHYKEIGYPKHIGMVETGIMIRKHNNFKCKLLCNEWATELLNFSHRDQLSFNYVCWKNKYIPGYMKNEFSLLNNNFFEYYAHR